MLSIAHSKATFEVLKRGGTTDIQQQANLCKLLGRDVCPEIYSIGEDYYTMEMLSEYPIEGSTSHLFEKIISLLDDKVWHQPLPKTVIYSNEWREILAEWAYKTFDSAFPCELIKEVYPESEYESCLIHGDPTFANCMLRGEQLILIDPVPARVMLPSTKYLDYGKLLQSAAGWEHLLDSRYSKDMSRIDFVLSYLNPANHRKALFWAMINCARVYPRAIKENVREWSLDRTKYFYERLITCMS